MQYRLYKGVLFTDFNIMSYFTADHAITANYHFYEMIQIPYGIIMCNFKYTNMFDD